MSFKGRSVILVAADKAVSGLGKASRTGLYVPSLAIMLTTAS